jgi:uncharacterized protein (UPF0179 family)
MMKKCVVCGRRLKDPDSAAAGVGPTCSKKLTPEAKREVANILSQGFDCRILDSHVIQVQIPEEQDEWPESISL